jgi:pSer/pThr/pTyr-binding forkhead associated (FHA) protein
VTSPDRASCRVCGLTVPQQAPILVARPPLGVLIFDSGDRVVIDRPVILGRDPRPVASSDPEPPVLHPVVSATGQVSRTHAELRAEGWDVVITDLDAMNGTALTAPGMPPIAIEPGAPTVVSPGSRVDLGGEVGFVFEVES